jgi:hypothetical protein
VRSYPSVAITVEKGLLQVVPGFICFKLVAPSLQPGEVGPCLVHGTWFPSHLPLKGTGPYQTHLGRNWCPQYPGYRIPIVAPESSVERVARAVHLTRGRSGTHMLLRVLPQVSVVRLWS